MFKIFGFSCKGNEVVNLVTGFDFNEVCCSWVQDAAAKSVTTCLELKVKKCNIHDAGKIGMSAIRELLQKDSNSKFPNLYGPDKLTVICN